MVDYDPFAPAVMDDPQPFYRRLRDEAPAYYMPKYDAWALSRFADVWECSAHPAFSAAKGTTPSQVLTKVQPVTPMLNLMDPPEHTQLRNRLRDVFMPKPVAKLEAPARALARASVEAALAKGELDVIGGFTGQLSVRVTCHSLGLPVADADHLLSLVNRFFARVPGVDGMTADGLAAAQELIEYGVALVRARRAAGHPAQDAVDMFCTAEIGGRRLADEEIASHLSMLVIGGSETFPKTFANAVLRLAEHPDQRAALAADPTLAPHAYQESLRYDMPTQFLCRTLTEDVERDGRVLRAGQGVCFLYASANHDEREFPDPDRFDIERRARRILSFGAGTHTCLGLHVARLEGRVCLEELLARIPEYEVDLARAERVRTEFVQGFASLPIRFAPR
jgi:cytochrome P450